MEDCIFSTFHCHEKNILVQYSIKTHWNAQNNQSYEFLRTCNNFILGTLDFIWPLKIVISISRNGLLKACARFIIERSEIRNKQHAFKSVHFECRMVLFSIECRKVAFCYFFCDDAMFSIS